MARSAGGEGAAGIRSHVRQLSPLLGATHKKRPSAHHPEPDELPRDAQPVPEDVGQGGHVLVRGDATQEDHLGSRRQRPGQPLGVGHQGLDVLAVVRSDLDVCDGAQLFDVDDVGGWTKTQTRHDDIHAGAARRRARESGSVRDLSAEVEPADESEDLVEGPAHTRAEAGGQGRWRVDAEEVGGALAGEVRWGDEEDARSPYVSASRSGDATPCSCVSIPPGAYADRSSFMGGGAGPGLPVNIAGEVTKLRGVADISGGREIRDRSTDRYADRLDDMD